MAEAQLCAQGTDCDKCSERRDKSKDVVKKFAQDMVERVRKRRLEARAREEEEEKRKPAREEEKQKEEEAEKKKEDGERRSKRKASPKKGKSPLGLRQPSEPAGPPPKAAKAIAKNEPKASAKPEPKAKAKTCSGLPSAALSLLHGALQHSLAPDREKESDLENCKEMDAQCKALKKVNPRRNVVGVTEENVNDQSFHDAGYYADRAAGRPHHIAWKEEKARRRAILDRRRGVADRAAERIKLDEKHRQKHEVGKRDQGKKVAVEQDTGDIETTVVDTRSSRGKAAAEVKQQAAPMGRRELEDFRQYPGDEQEVLSKDAERKPYTLRKRTIDYYARQAARRRAKRARKAQESKEEEDEDSGQTRVRTHATGPSVEAKAHRTLRPRAGREWLRGFDEGESAEWHGWKKLSINLDTGATATAIPETMDLEAIGFKRSPANETSYKTASSEHLADAGGAVLTQGSP